MSSVTSREMCEVVVIARDVTARKKQQEESSG